VQITSLEINELRIVERLELSPGAGINLIVGGNGAGKTTLLEAVYLAGRGRTFRHVDAGPMIRYGADSATVVVSLIDENTSRASIIGIRRKKRDLVCRLDGQDVKKRSVLAEALPVQWIGSQPQLFLEMGPEMRRRFIDMGMFHVEHDYFRMLSEFQRTLRQRNAAIRRGSSAEVRLWNQPLDDAAVALNHYRERFVVSLMPRVLEHIADWNLGVDLGYRFRCGWKTGATLREQLDQRTESDLRQGFTSIGPQRAELELTIGPAATPAVKRLSRGQQKMLVFAMHLALLDRIIEQTSSAPVLLIDDLAAELDRVNRQQILQALSERPAQVFLTAIDPDAIALSASGGTQMFHVEHGALT
jgi:DNA replication and repair protein RecF